MHAKSMRAAFVVASGEGNSQQDISRLPPLPAAMELPEAGSEACTKHRHLPHVPSSVSAQLRHMLPRLARHLGSTRLGAYATVLGWAAGLSTDPITTAACAPLLGARPAFAVRALWASATLNVHNWLRMMTKHRTKQGKKRPTDAASTEARQRTRQLYNALGNATRAAGYRPTPRQATAARRAAPPHDAMVERRSQDVAPTGETATVYNANVVAQPTQSELLKIRGAAAKEPLSRSGVLLVDSDDLRTEADACAYCDDGQNRYNMNLASPPDTVVASADKTTVAFRKLTGDEYNEYKAKVDTTKDHLCATTGCYTQLINDPYYRHGMIKEAYLEAVRKGDLHNCEMITLFKKGSDGSVVPGVGFQIVKPIAKAEELFAPYGSSYWFHNDGTPCFNPY